MTDEDKSEKKEQERITKEKLEEVEKTRNYINFFNPNAVTLMKQTPVDILTELGVRAYTGSRDVPKDPAKAFGFFQ